MMNKKALFFLFLCCVLVGFSLNRLYISFLEPPALKRATLYWWTPNKPPKSESSAWYKALRQEFLKHGYDIQTQGIHPIETSELVLIAFPHFPMEKIKTKKIFVWAVESPINISQPLSPAIEAKVLKIFTWRTDLVDNEKYIYLPVLTRLEEKVEIDMSTAHKKVLLTQISGNHARNSLYKKRGEAITWFLEHHPQDLIFYGSYWESLRDKLSPTLQSRFDDSYKGYVDDKIKALKKARFALAYENDSATDYVSEKIYDVMKAGTVPVYLGAPNITEYVPKECFINFNEFNSYETLYPFLKNMSEAEYLSYLSCIQEFLQSDKIDMLTGAYTAKKMSDTIFEVLKE